MLVVLIIRIKASNKNTLTTQLHTKLEKFLLDGPVVLRDSYNRPVSNLRISLTSKCNLSCIYCHAEGEKSPGAQLSAREIGEILRVAAGFDIRSVKFTGGEPTLRSDLVEIIRSIPPGMESSMTTNGTLLADVAADLKRAGLARVNVSLDSMNHGTYKKITGTDRLSDVLGGISSALDAGLTPIKLNMVVLKGINDHEVDDFLAYVRGNRNLILQLIELMQFNDCNYHGDLNGLEGSLAQRATQVLTRRMHHRKKFCLDGAEVEVVRPLHNTEFCAFCNRLRVTSDGNLKPCLLRNDNHVDIRGKQGRELEDLFVQAVRRREPYYR
jgi:cyclic pyranopterin phosphate synthase